MFTYEKRPVLPTRMWWCALVQGWRANSCDHFDSGCGWVDRYEMQISDPSEKNPPR
jgi:hypothetical protein